MQWLIDGVSHPGTQISFARMRLKAGAIASTHSHPNCDEVIYIVSGKAVVSIEGDRHALLAGDSVRVPTHAVHHIEASADEGADIVLSFSNGTRIYEAVPEPAPARAELRLPSRA